MLLDFHGYAWIFIDFHGLSWSYMDFVGFQGLQEHLGIPWGPPVVLLSGLWGTLE